MNTELENIIKRADSIMDIARRITNAANVHELNCCIGRVMTAKQLLEWYDETKKIEKYNEYMVKINEYIERLKNQIQKEIELDFSKSWL